MNSVQSRVEPGRAVHAATSHNKTLVAIRLRLRLSITFQYEISEGRLWSACVLWFLGREKASAAACQSPRIQRCCLRAYA